MTNWQNMNIETIVTCIPFAALGGAALHTSIQIASSLAVVKAMNLNQFTESRFRPLRNRLLKLKLKRRRCVVDLPSAPKIDLITPIAKVAAKGAIVGTYLKDELVTFWPEVTNNPHLIVSGLSGMGKTTLVNNIIMQLQARSISPIVFAFAEDLESPLNNPHIISASKGFGFNPLLGNKNPLDAAGSIRDAFKFIFPMLGEVQLAELYEVAKSLATSSNPTLHDLTSTLASVEASSNVIARIQELDDYRLFRSVEPVTLLDGPPSICVRLYDTDNEAIQRALQAFTLTQVYLEMKRRGAQSRITHAIVIDEAHLLAKLPFLERFAREARKYGVCVILASQSTNDFSDELYSAIANTIALRSDVKDCKIIARRIAPNSKQVNAVCDELKELPKFFALARLQDGKLKRIELAKGMKKPKPIVPQIVQDTWLSRVELCSELKMSKSRFYEVKKTIPDIKNFMQVRDIGGKATNYYSGQLIEKLRQGS